MKILFLFGLVVLASATDSYKKGEVESIFRKHLPVEHKGLSQRLASALERIPGMALALKTPITDATPQKLVASLERVILSIVTEVAAPCKHAMLVQVITGVIRSRVSQILYTCVNKIPLPAVEETVKEIKEQIEAKVENVLEEQGGDCHFERLMAVLPAMVDGQVAKEDTLAELLTNVAVYAKVTVLPLTTGGLLHCNPDKTQDVRRHLQQLESYLEKGFKETTERLSTNGPLKESIEEILEGPFGNIVTEVETLRRKFQKGEEKETYMQPFASTIINVVTNAEAVKKARQSGAEERLLKIWNRMVENGRSEKFIKTVTRFMAVQMAEQTPSTRDLEIALKTISTILENQTDRSPSMPFY